MDNFYQGGSHKSGFARRPPIADQELANLLGPDLTGQFMLAEHGQPLGDKADARLRQLLLMHRDKLTPGSPLYERAKAVLASSGYSGASSQTPFSGYDPSQEGYGPPIAGLPPTSHNLDAFANTFPGGGALTANSALGYDTQDVSQDAINYYLDAAKGSPFEGMNPAGVEMMADNPELLAQFLADQEGAGPNAAAFLGPRARAAMALSGMGMLGRSTQGQNRMAPDLTDAPSSDIDKLLAAQQFMDQFNQPGSQFVDVNAIYQDSFNRASNTNFEGLTDENGNPLGVEGSISLTNDALMSSAPFMSQETQAWLSSTLDYAALQYMEKIATGEITMSYPNYLRSLGIDQMLSGNP